MYDNYNYPLGADNENAPWNERETPEKVFGCEVTITLTKTCDVTTQDYILEEAEYPDYMGGIDTSDVNWLDEYESQYLPLPKLMERMADLLEQLQPTGTDRKSINLCSEIRDLCEQARDWETYDVDVQEL